MEEMFTIQARWDPEIFFVEGGVIWKSVYPMIRNEMQARDIYLNFEVLNPVKDKATRGRSFQKRMKSGMMRFDTKGSWYPGHKEELLKFTGGKQAKLDDQFDSDATLCIGLDMIGQLEEEDFEEVDELELEENQYYRENAVGRNRHTGY
jgi:hypothetical protein